MLYIHFRNFAIYAQHFISSFVLYYAHSLITGLADHLNANMIKCFGPCQKAAQIEASKEFAKSFMDSYKIPTAKWKSFTNVEDAKKHILRYSYLLFTVRV